MKHLYVGGIALLTVLLGAACNPVPYDTANDGSNTTQQLDTNSEQNNTQDSNISAPDERTTLENELRQAFAQKYTRAVEEIRIEIGLARDDKFVRGEVGFINPGETTVGGGGIFFAVRNSITGSWTIVHDGNGVIPCEPLELADFPRDMMGGCYTE
ncbi:MAG: hypothetical protein WCW16_00525 [Candidatus Magasanikbacteria bacterium]